MTVDQMNDFIQDYCANAGFCESCELEHLCKPIFGNFKDNAKVCEEAYNVIVHSNVDHPSHYNQGGIECLDAMMAAYGEEATATFCLTNAFKYLWRTEHKNGIQDIDKAIWYLNKYKELKTSD